MSNSQSPNTWYNPLEPLASYEHTICRWGAALAATSKALAALFDRMAEHHTEATRDMARLSKDPARASEAYTAYASRMMQLQTEMQGALEKITRDADLLYENIRRGIDGETAAPFTSPMGAAVVEPSMKYGHAASQVPEGPGDWRFDPEQRLTSYDGAADAIPPLPAIQLPMNPPSSAMGQANAMPQLPAYSAVPSLATMAPQPSFPMASNGAGVKMEPPQQIVPPATPIPPAPQDGYPVPSKNLSDSSGVRYRCDGYRRVARAKP